LVKEFNVTLINTVFEIIIRQIARGPVYTHTHTHIYIYIRGIYKKLNSVALVRTIPTEGPQLVGEVSVNFCR
jgi:hypothetical protein